MQVFTLGLGNWLRCLSARSPLVRVTDRLEAAALLLIVIVALVAAPIAGAVGTATNESLARQYAIDRATRHRVVATVTGDSILSPEAYEEPFLTPIRWQFLGGQHEGNVRTYRMKAGDTTNIWVDDKGEQGAEPLTDENAATEAAVVGFALWLTSVGIATALWMLLRSRLNRLRYAAWDRELDDLAGNDGRTNRNA